MKLFIIKSLVFALLITGTLAIVLSFADGNTDNYYLRLTTPQQSNLLLGTSRTAQGLHPVIFDSIMDRKFYNYSFTVVYSPYGTTYLESIKEKLAEGVEDGIFVLEVNPWGLSSTTVDPNDSLNFRESTGILGNTPCVNCKPNYTYLLKNYGGDYYRLLTSNTSPAFLHDDGWLEISVPMDSLSVAKRLENKLRSYTDKYSQEYWYSSLRLDFLRQTIQYLKQHGQVYLVRLPIHPRMMEIDEQLVPDFEEKIQTVVPYADGYLDLTPRNEEFEYTDGNHLHKSSGAQISRMVASWIQQQQ